MARADIYPILKRAEYLAKEIEDFVPPSTKVITFRADLAGLLVVSMAASYESCVKEVLMTYAGRHHVAFGTFAQNQYKKINSRISIRDLHNYAETFDSSVNLKFKKILKERTQKLSQRIGKDFRASYGQVLDWRHDFAHAGTRNTTVEEAITTHRLAKRVIYAFDDAFNF